MEEIVIKDERDNSDPYFDIIIDKDKHLSDMVGISTMGKTLSIGSHKQAERLAYKLFEILGISIDDIKRQAFEAGREHSLSPYGKPEFEYPTFEYYNQSLKHKDNG